MADTPKRPDHDAPAELPSEPMPDSHAGEPMEAAHDEGLRPEAVGTPARPTENEPLGPYGELLPTVGAEAKEEASPDGDPEAEALLQQMGVEEEGIEGGQILGLIISVGVAVVAMVVILIYLFVIPFQTQVDDEAEDVDQYIELEQVRVEGLAKLDHYERADSSAYAVPIGRAMGLVAADYAGAAPGDAANVPTTRQRWNTLTISYGPPRAVQAPADRGPLTAPVPETGAGGAPLDRSVAPGELDEGRTAPLGVRRGETAEEVGVDEDAETTIDAN